MNETLNHLPLHRLFVQLQNSGIFVGATERLRVQQLLADSKGAWLTSEGRESLMYEIAPLVCRNQVEQDAFYKIYLDFLKTLNEPLVVKRQRSIGFFQKYGKLMLWFLGGMALLSGVWLSRDFLFKKQIEVSFREINNRIKFSFGDTAVYKNITAPKDTTGVLFVWKVYSDFVDRAGKPILEIVDSNKILQFDIERLNAKQGFSPYLEAYSRKTGDTLGVGRDILKRVNIVCSTKPQPKDTTIRIEIDGQNVRFFPPLGLDKNWKITWDFGDGNFSELLTPEHFFSKEGTYQITLFIEDSLQKGECVTQISKTIQIGGGIPLLQPQTLYKDDLNPTWVYTLLTKFFIVTALLVSLFFFWKWWNRPSITQPLPEPKISPALKRAFEPKDRSPYTIPYRSNNAQVRVAAEQMELAKILRRRQEGQQASLHIPRTIGATIEKMGFTDLRFALNTRPTQYLFLIDTQNEASHQAQLFHYLVEMLVGQEVLADVFFYKNDFARFWNRLHPEGLTLEQVAMQYGDRRLVIFGDGDRLVSDAPDGEPFNKTWTDGLKRWQQRMLVTPTPIASWTYREARLYRFFAVFHADLGGLMQAAQFVDKEMDDENLPLTFAEWERQCLRSRVDTDTDRSWRTPAEHRDYLREARCEEPLYRWLRALTVYPELNWNVTIAIGRALGIEVRYEHLLVLARIPWLQEGVMSYSLWRAWWHELPKDEERVVREAVRTELLAVAEKCADGYADQKVQTRLAVQDFALKSGDSAAQDAMRYVLSQIEPSPLLGEELDLVVARYRSDFNKVPGKAGSTIAAFLKQELKISKPFFTHHFWFGLLALLFFLVPILIDTSRWEGFDDLNKGILGWFVAKTEDEAARLNNLAVTAWYDKDFSEKKYTAKDMFQYDFFEKKSYTAAQLLAEAQTIRLKLKAPKFIGTIDVLYQSNGNSRYNSYPLAQTNIARIFFNDGVQFLYEQNDPARAIKNFRVALGNDSLRITAAEAIAVAFYKNNQIDSACYWIQQVLATDLGYFNWLACGVSHACRQVANVKYSVALRNKDLNSTEINEIAQDPSGVLDRQTLAGTVPLGKTVELLDSTKHFWKVQYGLKIGYIAKIVNNKPLLVACGLIGNLAADRDEDGVPDEKDKCPDEKGKSTDGCPEMDSIKLLVGSWKATGVPFVNSKQIGDIYWTVYEDKTMTFTRMLGGNSVNSSFGTFQFENGILSESYNSGNKPTSYIKFVKDGIDLTIRNNNLPEEKGQLRKYRKAPYPFTDADKDGYPNNLDKCPFEKGSFENEGCPSSSNSNPSLEPYLPIILYFDNDEPDKRTLAKTTSRDYQSIYVDFIRRKHQFIDEATKGMSGDDLNIVKAEMDTFFEQDVRGGWNKLMSFSEVLYEMLERGDQIEITLSGFTSPRAGSSYNLNLSSRRISSVFNHFDLFDGGIFKPFIQSGQLKIRLEPFGESKAAPGISDIQSDIRRSIYSINAARENRVEIIGIRTNK